MRKYRLTSIIGGVGHAQACPNRLLSMLFQSFLSKPTITGEIYSQPDGFLGDKIKALLSVLHQLSLAKRPLNCGKNIKRSVCQVHFIAPSVNFSILNKLRLLEKVC